jgi:hypothetical protein|tara:strand:+ start:209 stop:1780 length:1572 start_codon:yes stop_codon:yes gene_type:complete
MSARTRYDYLASDRSQFLEEARQAAELTLPYLIRGNEEYTTGMKNLKTPYQSVGAKGVVTLASKLMLALLPVQTSFFKLQLDESQLGEEFPPEMKSELDLSFAKVERIILESISASDDRVAVHQALLHLVVSGNALVFMSKHGLKIYPLNRYVVERDGNGQVIEIVTKESISKQLIENQLPKELLNSVNDDGSKTDEVDVYTHIKRDNNRFIWHQEVGDKVLKDSQGKAPIDVNPWIPLRFNTVDGEGYGRGRVGQFIGDLKSLEGLSQALVEGSAAAAKVVFTVSPSSTTKPSTLAQAGNGAIIQGRPDDIGVIQVGKTADFRTAYEMAGQLERRLGEAFLVLNIRQSERTTAEEVRMTQMELESQLGGLFSLLTVDFLVPYLNKKLSDAQKKGDIPKIPKNIVKPTIVAGINALGRGQDRESLGQFLTILAQTLGPESIGTFINQEEVIKRLAAAQGIDVLNLVRSMQEVQAEQQQAMEQQMAMQNQQMSIEAMKTPAMDPSKNGELAAQEAMMQAPQPPV